MVRYYLEAIAMVAIQLTNVAVVAASVDSETEAVIKEVVVEVISDGISG